jgi:membrane-bound serine protease (ClpP class)
MVGEAFAPSGALAIGGVVAFLVGSFFLFEPADIGHDFALSLPLVMGTAAACIGITFLVLIAAAQARRRPATSGAEQLLDSRGTVIEWNGHRGQVRVLGEVWAARGGDQLNAGDVVRITHRDGLTVTVEPD